MHFSKHCAISLVPPGPITTSKNSTASRTCSSLEEDTDGRSESCYSEPSEASPSELDEHSDPFLSDSHSFSEGPVVVPSSPSALSDLLLEDDVASINSADDAFVPHGAEVIGNMWEGFSVDSYVPSKSSLSTRRDKCRLVPPKKRWSPSITIPKPFSMTIHEEQKGSRKHKAFVEAEIRRLEREALENVELLKQFRANPVPATTFLPLYDLITARNEERRSEVKKNSMKILKSQERPFTFMVREEEKRKLKEKEQKHQEQEEAESLRQSRQFKARPVPNSVFDKTVDEKMKEMEEYRPIRVKLRAMELLASSHLPGNMQARGRGYTIGHLHQQRREELSKRAFLGGDRMFQPVINQSVPNYEKSYAQFENQLLERKKQSITTVAEPFSLRINQRIKERSENRQNGEENKPQTCELPAKVPVTPPVQSNKHPVPTTRLVELRHRLIQERLSNEAEKEELKGVLEEERRQRNKGLKEVVSVKSMENDLSGWLKAKQQENLQQLRYSV